MVAGITAIVHADVDAGAQEGPNDSYYGGSSTEANNSANSNKSDNEYGQSVSQFNGDTGGDYIGY